MTNEELLQISFGVKEKRRFQFNDCEIILYHYCKILDELQTNIQKCLTLLATDFDKDCNLRMFNIECEINDNIKVANKMKKDIINMGYELPLEIIEKEDNIKEWYKQIPNGIITEVIL